MTDYERGFNDGFATALQRMGRSAGNGAAAGWPINPGSKKISIGFHPAQFSFIVNHSMASGGSIAASVRQLVDRAIVSLGASASRQEEILNRRETASPAEIPSGTSSDMTRL